MGINIEDVAMVIHGGLSAVCAMCENYWSAADAGENSCGQRCGGPISGGSFDKYRGPIVNFSSLCFVCGSKPTHLVQAKDSFRSFGACSTHVELVKKLEASGRPPVRVVVKSPNGVTASDEAPIEPDKIKIKI